MIGSITILLATFMDFLVASLIPAAIVAVAGILMIGALMKIAKSLLEKSGLESAAHSLILTVAKVVLYGLLALIVASKLGIDVTGIVAMASVLTLAVSLSIQNILTNVFGGFTLMSTKPFHAGDFVEIAGQSGTVREIGMTYTKLETPDSKLVSIPNSAVTAAQIVNFTATGVRRVDITVSASYDAPVDKVLEVLAEAAKVPTAKVDPAPFAAVQEYGASTIVYALKVWSTADDYWTTYFDVTRKVKEVFDANGILMSYPHLNIHLDK